MATVAGTGAALAAKGALGFFEGQETLKVGLIGCGGRGSGAARDSFESAPGMVLWSMGDVFPDRIESAKNGLKDALGKSFQVTDDRTFTGFDAYKAVIASGVNIVILTTPPGFRPIHLAAAVDAGKHVFMEKPVAVDAPGVRSVMASGEKANEKGLCIVAGTQRRDDVAYMDCIKRIHDGQIGEVTAMYCYWNQGGLWMHPRQEKWSDVEWQLRNWLYFTALSGDHICEQHIHNIDVCNWVQQAHPVKAMGVGGRQVRTNAAYGHIFDHFAIEFEYENGVKLLSMCRQIDGTVGRVNEHVVGTRGSSNCATSIKGASGWRWEGDRPNPYVQEHKRLVAAIRSGNKVNDAKRVAESTMSAIMGRMAAYSGLEVEWDEAMKSEISLLGDLHEFGPMEVPEVPMPGTTKAW
ncbi:MAG: Gfo/Idh/MocA family protein [Fimbriimonadaceae bacterium]